MAGSAPVRTEVDAYQFPVSAQFAMPVAAAASQAVKASPGRLCSLVITTTGTAAASSTVNIYDNAAANSGTVIGSIPGNAAAGTRFPFDMPAMNGIWVQGVANGPAFTVGYS